jgi:hypothetical protein
VFGVTDFVLLRALPSADSALRVMDLTGPHPDLRFAIQDADPDWAEALAETEIGAQFANEVLPIYPLLLPADAREDKNPTGFFEPVVMIDGVAEGRLTVLGVTGGYTMHGLHLEATLAALRRKHGDLSLDRKDVAPWTVLAWARMTTQQTLEDIHNRKYFPSFYLERPDVDSVPDRLSETPGKALLLIGDAGSGKSSLIARLAERLCTPRPDETTGPELAEESEAVVAYLSGRADYAAVGRGQVHINQLDGGKFLESAARGQPGRQRMKATLQGDLPQILQKWPKSSFQGRVVKEGLGVLVCSIEQRLRFSQVDH